MDYEAYYRAIDAMTADDIVRAYAAATDPGHRAALLFALANVMGPDAGRDHRAGGVDRHGWETATGLLSERVRARLGLLPVDLGDLNMACAQAPKVGPSMLAVSDRKVAQ